MSLSQVLETPWFNVDFEGDNKLYNKLVVARFPPGPNPLVKRYLCLRLHWWDNQDNPTVEVLGENVSKEAAVDWIQQEMSNYLESEIGFPW